MTRATMGRATMIANKELEKLEAAFDDIFGEPTIETKEERERQALLALLIDHYYNDGPKPTDQQLQRLGQLNAKLEPLFKAHIDGAYGSDGDE